MNIRRRPTMSPSRPPATRVSPNVSAYPETIHCTDWEEAPSPCSIEGTATFTIVTSSRDMNPTSRVTARARHRFGSGSGGLVIRPCGYPRAAVGNDNQRFVSRGENDDRHDRGSAGHRNDGRRDGSQHRGRGHPAAGLEPDGGEGAAAGGRRRDRGGPRGGRGPRAGGGPPLEFRPQAGGATVHGGPGRARRRAGRVAAAGRGGGGHQQPAE